MDPDALNLTQKPAQAIIAAPLVSLQRGAQRPPQDLPNLMSHLKPSTSPSLFSTLPSVGPSKPSSSASLAVEPQSKKHADMLAELGIKVRDFAYESKLPPVKPYRVRQFQPGPRPLKRTRDGEVDDVFQDNTITETAEGDTSRRSKLKREGTEADITRPRRPHNLGYSVDIRDPHPQCASPSQSLSQSQPANFSQPSSSRPLSDPYDVTPTVTPNGSLIWPDTVTSNDIPAFQLDTESQASDPAPLTCSQLGMSRPEPEPSDPTGTGLVGTLTPMSSLSSVGSDVPPKPLDSWTSNEVSRSPTASPTPKEPATPSPPNSRYELRRRHIPLSSRSPTKSRLLERKTMYKAAYPLPRPRAYSIQSSHPKQKASLGRVAPTHGSPNNCDETMIVR